MRILKRILKKTLSKIEDKIYSYFINKKLDFITEYGNDKNAASLSKYDANANVGHKNIATLGGELPKGDNIKLNRKQMYIQLKKDFGRKIAKQYLKDIDDKIIYVHDESATPGIPYCAAVTMTPFVYNGLKNMGGGSEPPKHLHSFCGGFVNLCYLLAAQFAGAIATPEFLLYFDYFARKKYGDDYLKTNTIDITDYLQQIVYTLNQPAASRGYQCVFWNIAFFDKYYFDSLFSNILMPDSSVPNWTSLNNLQTFFLKWINQERTKAELTFPVMTISLYNEKKENNTVNIKDKKMLNVIIQELEEGNSFFIYQSESVDSLSSCCRLQNQIDIFNFSIGGASVDTGSIKVITINYNRMIQKKYDKVALIKRIHKYLRSHRNIIEDNIEKKLLDAYMGGYVTLKKQYSTIGINGVVEAAEFLGLTPNNNDEYKKWLQNELGEISGLNRIGRTKYNMLINTEYVPAENLGVKNAKWDKEDGLFVPRDCYNSYFYIVEDEGINVLDKIELHGKEVLQYLDGGSAAHLNLEEHLSKEQYKSLIQTAANVGSNYITFNVKSTICNECGYINKNTTKFCIKCNSNDIDYGTRIIGYFKRVSAWSEERQREEARRKYHID